MCTRDEQIEPTTLDTKPMRQRCFVQQASTSLQHVLGGPGRPPCVASLCMQVAPIAYGFENVRGADDLAGCQHDWTRRIVCANPILQGNHTQCSTLRALTAAGHLQISSSGSPASCSGWCTNWPFFPAQRKDAQPPEP